MKQLTLKDVNKIMDILLKNYKNYSFFLSGSAYRNNKYPEDIDLVIKSKKKHGNMNSLLQCFDDFFDIEYIMEKGKKRSTIIIKFNNKSIKINIWFLKFDEDKAYMLFSRRYPKNFIIRIRSNLKKKGYKMTDYEFLRRRYHLKDKQIKLKSIKDIFRYINDHKIMNLPFRTPEEEDNKKDNKKLLYVNV